MARGTTTLLLIACMLGAAHAFTLGMTPMRHHMLCRPALPQMCSEGAEPEAAPADDAPPAAAAPPPPAPPAEQDSSIMEMINQIPGPILLFLVTGFLGLSPVRATAGRAHAA